MEAFDLEAGTLTFYREKVDLVQIHRLTRDTWRAARAYLSNPSCHLENREGVDADSEDKEHNFKLEALSGGSMNGLR